MTSFGKFPEATMRSLAEEAVDGALKDAGLLSDEVDMVFFSNAAGGTITGQEMIRGQVSLRHSGLLGKPIINVENACASASTAFHLAVMAVESGRAEVAVAVGAEKMAVADKSRAFAALATAVDLFQLDDLERAIDKKCADQPREAGAGSFFMDLYAAEAREYMARTGATPEDFATVAVKSHAHAALNPHAQFRTPVTVEEVLASRTIAHPLTLLMCSPIGDGAAAVVVTSAARARRLGASAIRIEASVLTSGTDRETGDASAVQRAAYAAYAQAGVDPAELDVLELHDAAAPAELMLYEELQLCASGEGPALLRSGRTALGGSMVVNPSGGLLSKGHPIGASGCAQLVEIVDQLRGRCGERQVSGARLGLAQNGGGYLTTDNAAMSVTILTT
jgi:acetyl-CoA acetyltransferase